MASHVDNAHAKNVKINAWTVNSRKSIERLYAIGIDGIITNDIDLTKEVLTRKE